MDVTGVMDTTGAMDWTAGDAEPPSRSEDSASTISSATSDARIPHCPDATPPSSSSGSEFECSAANGMDVDAAPLRLREDGAASLLERTRVVVARDPECCGPARLGGPTGRDNTMAFSCQRHHRPPGGRRAERRGDHM